MKIGSFLVEPRSLAGSGFGMRIGHAAFPSNNDRIDSSRIANNANHKARGGTREPRMPECEERAVTKLTKAKP